MNQIMAIHPKKTNGIWAFHDESVGLIQEPFVGAINQFIDELANGKNKVSILFSHEPFPSHQLKLTRQHEEMGGWWYQHPSCMSGWLCPALFKYFDVAPLDLYVKVETGKD